jgi:hypothetical protein
VKIKRRWREAGIEIELAQKSQHRFHGAMWAFHGCPKKRRNTMLQSKTLSADESYWELFELKAQQGRVTASGLFRAMVEEFLTTYDPVRDPKALTPVWRKREGGHA